MYFSARLSLTNITKQMSQKIKNNIQELEIKLFLFSKTNRFCFGFLNLRCEEFAMYIHVRYTTKTSSEFLYFFFFVVRLSFQVICEYFILQHVSKI